MTVWSPHSAKDKELLEKVQRRHTRMFNENVCTSSPPLLCVKFGDVTLILDW